MVWDTAKHPMFQIKLFGPKPDFDIALVLASRFILLYLEGKLDFKFPHDLTTADFGLDDPTNLQAIRELAEIADQLGIPQPARKLP